MEEKSYSERRADEIPLSVYVRISGRCSRISGAYEAADGCYVDVYRVLDEGKEGQVNHVIKIGSFDIKNLEGMSAREFVGSLKEGILGVLH